MIEKLFNLPTPMQILSDPVSIIIMIIFFAFMIGEELFPGRPLPDIKFWKIKGITAFIVYFSCLPTYLYFGMDIWEAIR